MSGGEALAELLQDLLDKKKEDELQGFLASIS